MKKRKKQPRRRRTLGSNIRDHRTAQGLTQLALAKVIKVDRSCIGHIETGTRSPTYKTLKKLASALHVPCAVLVVD